MRNIANRVVVKSAAFKDESFRNNNRYNLRDHDVLTIPINAFGGTDGYGMVSYPNYRGKCRALNYPSLDLWYNACDRAGVRCRHIYLSRKPLSVLKSTIINRRHNRDGFLNAIHTYKSYLHIISSEIKTHRQKTVGCMSLLEGTYTWWDEIRILGGWENETEYETYMRATYRPRSSNSSSASALKPDWLPDTVNPYLRAYNQVDEEVLQLCQLSRSQNVELREVYPLHSSDHGSTFVGNHRENARSIIRAPLSGGLVRFVLLVGLESGHDQEAWEGTSILSMDSGVLGETFGRLQTALIDPVNHTGLLNAHCSSDWNEVNATSRESEIVDLLKELYAKVDGSLNSDLKEEKWFPVNVAKRTANSTIDKNFSDKASRFQSSGQSCQKLGYLSLDLWYNACEMANISCGHIFLFDTPERILTNYLKRGTPNRVENESTKPTATKGIVATAHLQKSLLHTAASELERYANRTMACLNMRTPRQHNATYLFPRQEKNASADNHEREISKEELVESLGPYFRAFEDAFKNAVRVCKDAIVSKASVELLDK